jgi:hypothetical protein
MPTQATYRKERSSAFWHFCMNCKDWPAKDSDEISSAVNPPLERFCAECAKLEKARIAKTLMNCTLARELSSLLSRFS